MKQPTSSEPVQDSLPAPSARKRDYKRRCKSPKLRLQLRLLWPLLGLFLLVTILQGLALGVELYEYANQLPSDGPQLGEAVPGILLKSVLISVALLLPAVLLVGIHVTFRIAGPLYRFERHLETVASGEWPEPCQIRRADDLQDFCKLLNRGLESAYEQGRQQRAEAEPEDIRPAA